MSDYAQYFRPRNWSKHQSGRRQQGAPWIRNYTTLLNDPEYMNLSAPARGVLHGIWLLYGRREKPIPMSNTYIGGRLGVDGRAVAMTMQKLLDNDFIELCEKDVQSVYTRVEKKVSKKRDGARKQGGSSSPPARSPLRGSGGLKPISEVVRADRRDNGSSPQSREQLRIVVGREILGTNFERWYTDYLNDDPDAIASVAKIDAIIKHRGLVVAPQEDNP